MHGQQHRPAGERGRDPAALRAERRQAEAAAREQQVAGDVDREADERRVHDRPRPADALAGVAVREEHEHGRHAEAHRVDVAGRVRNRARLGAEPAQHGLDAGEQPHERRRQHQREPDALAEAATDLLVASRAVSVCDQRRDGHQHAQTEQPERLVIAVAHCDAGERPRPQAAGHDRVGQHHAGQHQVVDGERPGERQDRARVARERVLEAGLLGHGASRARRGGRRWMLAF